MSAMTEFFNDIDLLVKQYENETGLDDDEFILALDWMGEKYIEDYAKEQHGKI